MILFEKYGQHQPLNRQAERYGREGVPLSLSTLADQVGACCAVLAPLLRPVEAHVFAAERLHGDDITVPVLATGKTDTGRCWVYVRDDRPFGGPDPPAAMFYYNPSGGPSFGTLTVAQTRTKYRVHYRLHRIDKSINAVVNSSSKTCCCTKLAKLIAAAKITNACNALLRQWP